MKSRQEIKALAKEAMRMQRGTAILLILVYLLLSVAVAIVDLLITATLGMLVSWIVYIAAMSVVLVVGVNMYGEYIKIFKQEKADVGELFSGLKINFLRKLGGMAWMLLWYFLWSLLFIIPGIIKLMSYFFIEFILVDCPNVTARQALKVSMRITQGHKMKIFIFTLSWIGWFLLGMLTLGILLVVYVGPYFATATAGLYIEIRDEALATGRITREELGWDAEAASASGADIGFEN